MNIGVNLYKKKKKVLYPPPLVVASKNFFSSMEWKRRMERLVGPIKFQ